MKKSNEALRLKSVIQHAPKDCIVLVAKEYAQYFTDLPGDKRTYVVEDPRRPGVFHWTDPDGTYSRHEKRTLPYKVPEFPLTIYAKRVKGKKPKKSGLRIAGNIRTGVTVPGSTDLPPCIALIDINRVMRISGFKTSFIYEQPDFPKPVKLGNSRRSPVRWVESEIFAWCEALISKRNTNAVSN